jgi:hypothetical protein
MIHYSTIVPYYVKVDHNLTFVNSMTLSKQRRTENKGISILLLVETHLALSKTIQNHDADFLHWSKVHSLFSFEIWIFHSGHPDCDNYLIIFEAIASTYVQRCLVWVAFASAAEICLENHCNIGKVQSSCLS